MIGTRTRFGLALAAATLLGTLAQAQTKGGDVVIAIAQAPPSLDAHVTSAQAARNINLHIYETLYARDENAKPVPDLAEGVKISEDGKTYVFTLRRGVKFHNGKEMTAEDAAASLERYRKVGASAALLGAVDTVKATGPHELTVTLKSVQSTFLDNLSSPRAPIAIYPAEEAAKPANQVNFIGTGPFKYVEYRPDSHVRLQRNDDYVPNPNYQKRDGFAGKKEVFIDTVTFRFMPEMGARSAGLEAGDIHLVETIDGPTAKRLSGNKNFQVHKVLPFSLQVIKFNHAQAPTDDVNFRRAVAAALDMEEIMEIAHADVNIIDGGWVFPNSPYYVKDGLELYNQRNLDKAKEHLKKSNYKGEKLTFILDNIRPNIDTATVLQQRMQQIGVNVELSVADWPTVSKIGFTPTGWHFWTHGFGIEPFEGPASVIAPWVKGTSQQKADAEIDRLHDAINAEMDEGKRKALFGQFQKHMWENAVAVQAGNYGLFQPATARLKNFAPYRIPRMWGVWLDK
ncbi:MAG TPA: ABC transporter substrate-binding protein [Beijerinckiaceae bacterium]|nr:ABC transporter substrate-binding protein [Beijerinckiaceae bacterium]